jgi:hypothetical protein
MRFLSSRKAAILDNIQKLEAAASQYFVMNQQADLIFILGHLQNADAGLATNMFSGNSPA